jgi:hypothetical protein
MTIMTNQTLKDSKIKVLDKENSDYHNTGSTNTNASLLQ